MRFEIQPKRLVEEWKDMNEWRKNGIAKMNIHSPALLNFVLNFRMRIRTEIETIANIIGEFRKILDSQYAKMNLIL